MYKKILLFIVWSSLTLAQIEGKVSVSPKGMILVNAEIGMLDKKGLFRLKKLLFGEAIEKQRYLFSPLIIYVPEVHFPPDFDKTPDSLLAALKDNTPVDLAYPMEVHFQIYWTLRELVENYGITLICKEGKFGPKGKGRIGKAKPRVFGMFVLTDSGLRGINFRSDTLSYIEREEIIQYQMMHSQKVLNRAVDLLYLLYGSRINFWAVDSLKLLKEQIDLEFDLRSRQVPLTWENDTILSPLPEEIVSAINKLQKLRKTRSQIMIDQTIEAMKETDLPVAILITGAAHYPDIIEYCRKKRISLIAIKVRDLPPEFLWEGSELLELIKHWMKTSPNK